MLREIRECLIKFFRESRKSRRWRLEKLPKKRRNRGRAKGDKGRSARVQCDGCGAWIPRDKAIKVTKPVPIVDPQLARELRKRGAMISKRVVTKYLCVSCAIFQGVVKVRSEEERKKALPLR